MNEKEMFFKNLKERKALKHIETKPFKSGKVGLTYSTNPE